ncbi:dTDP-4-dehydrorhamnose reductase [Longirhabdus pacifica]|uniref:dTDP-4-dehydrorhamnose reductase n=1 Tax=Longirhabdus pacifica TaxID=2305227 RepID=UPI0010091BCE|nr:dTDP-4-dehydrorhamnose reductase [Longirhabdus pacifica]
MKILITGANGQLGQDMALGLCEQGEIFALSRNELDITNHDEVMEKVKAIQPDIILHTAAYTNVDKAEEEKDLAFLVNAYGTKHVAMAAEQVKAKLVYFSTDYVFDGASSVLYQEFDQTNPINYYGKSKLAGERFVERYCKQSFIIRVSWLYGLYGKNFVKSIINQAKMKKPLRVIDDQIGSPTFTHDVVQFLRELIITSHYGIYHVSNTGSCSWHEFATHIVDLLGFDVNVASMKSSALEQTRAAKRPHFSTLDHQAIRLHGFSVPRHWKEGLQDFVQQYKAREG